MLLAIDIGNTLTKFGFFDKDSLVRRFESPTLRENIAAEFLKHLQNQTIHAVIVSTVVPELQKQYTHFFRANFNIEPIFVDVNANFDLKINYSPSENLGVDRLVAAFAALEKYRRTCIVCDFGTATTIDVVTEKREFLGGIIAPGMQTMSESLFKKTSQLPQITIEKPANVIGNTTSNAIKAGIFFGYIGLVDGIVARMQKEIGEPASVIATGGFAELLAENTKKIEIVDDNLLLEGLRLIYEKRFR